MLDFLQNPIDIISFKDKNKEIINQRIKEKKKDKIFITGKRKIKILFQEKEK
jgi:hypothetical protein